MEMPNAPCRSINRDSQRAKEQMLYRALSQRTLSAEAADSTAVFQRATLSNALSPRTETRTRIAPSCVSPAAVRGCQEWLRTFPAQIDRRSGNGPTDSA